MTQLLKATLQSEGSAVQLQVSVMIRLMKVAGTQTCLHGPYQEVEERKCEERATCGKSDERVRTGKKRKDRKTAKVRGEKGDKRI